MTPRPLLAGDQDAYVPAAGRPGLTGAYDLMIALTMRERRFRRDLADQVLAGGEGQPLEVLDVGAGTGTLAIALAGHGAHVEAVDGDPDVLRRAQAKPGAQRVRWHQGRAEALPLADACFDRVVCSLVLHHLADSVKQAALGEALRVLRPGGRLHVADWGAPRDVAMGTAFRLLQALDGRANTQSHRDGLIPRFIADAGFSEVTARGRLRTAWGQLELISARRGGG